MKSTMMRVFFMFLMFDYKNLMKWVVLMVMTLNMNNFYIAFQNLDSLSFNMSLLTIIVVLSCLSYLKSEEIILKGLMIILMMFLILFFNSNNFFIFYLSFEMTMLPILFIVMGWGYQVERVQASFYLFLYMIFFSFPFLLFFMSSLKNYSFFSLFNKMNLLSSNMCLWIIGIFLVKSPLYLFHFWLPKAHVEASVIGSMLLAGILLKLGGFGLYRFMSLMHSEVIEMLFFFFSFMVLMSVFMCVFQSDLKSMIAYSSVNHMTLMIMSMFMMSCFSMKGSVILMISHGVLSPMMFFFMNIVYYQTHSRIFYFSQSILFMSKSTSMMFFLVTILNMNLPIFYPFISEMFFIFGILSISKIFFSVFMILSVFSCYYNLFMLVNLLYGKIKIFNMSFMTNLKHMMTITFSLFLMSMLMICLCLI